MDSRDALAEADEAIDEALERLNEAKMSLKTAAQYWKISEISDIERRLFRMLQSIREQ